MVLNYCSVRADGPALQRAIGTVLSLPIAHTPACQETTEYVNDIMKELDPDSKKTVAVKKMNRFAQYLFGYQNAIALPGLNTILVNEAWLEKLPEEQKKFLIGRSLVHMNKPLEYALYKYILPLLTQSFVELNSTFTVLHVPPSAEEKAEMDNEELNYFSNKFNQGALHWGLSLLGSLINKYFSRRLEYEADKEAALKLNCIDGALDLLKKTNRFTSQDPIGALCSTIPLLSTATIVGDSIRNVGIRNRATKDALFLEKDLTRLGIQEKQDEAFKEYRARHTVKIGALPLGQFHAFKIPAYLRDAVPGRFNNISTRLEGFLLNLPLVRYFWSYPRPFDRIKALKALAYTLQKEQAKSA